MVKIILILVVLLVASPCIAGDTILSEWVQVEYSKNILEESQEFQMVENPITGEMEEQLVTIHTVKTITDKTWMPQVGSDSQNGKYVSNPCKWRRIAPVDKLKAGDVAVLDVECPKATKDDIKKGSDVVIDATVDITIANKINTKLGTSLNLTGKTKEEATEILIDTVKGFKKKAVVIEP